MMATQLRISRTHGLASRRTKDSHAFMQEEKFDTWLDLGNIIELGKISAEDDVWLTSNMKVINHIISPDSIAMLHHMGITPGEVSEAVVTPTLPALLVNHTLKSTIKRNHMSVKSFQTHLDKIRRSSLTAFLMQQAHLLSNCDAQVVEKLLTGSDVWLDKMKDWPREVYSSYCVMEDMMYLLSVNKVVHEFHPGKSANQRGKAKVEKVNKVFNTHNGKIKMPSLDATVQLSHDVVIFKFAGIKYLLNRQLLLEVVNKCTELFSSLLYVHLTSGTAHDPGHYLGFVKFMLLMSHEVIKHCRYHNYKVDLHKENLGFTFLKVVEGLGVAEIIRREDSEKGWANTALQNHLWRSIYEDKLDHHSVFSQSSLGKLFKVLNISSIGEFIGCVKLCGHPSIEVELGLQKLYDRTHEEIKVSPDHINRAIAVNKRDMCINFYNKYGHYPNLREIDKLPVGPLRDLLIHSVNPNSPRGIQLRGSIKLESWGSVKLGKNAEFDPINNELVLLKDKALGVIRSKILTNLAVTSALEANDKVNVLGDFKERRVLLRFLLSPHLSDDFHKFLDSYSKNPPWQQAVLEHLVFKLTPKELEEKPEGRMFGASPLNWRNARIIQECNVMDLMDDLIPDQTMTPNELAMIKKLYAFRIFNKVYPGHTLLQVSFDFSKWNNSMRSESIDIPAKELLDPWFDHPIFGQTMVAYHHALYYYMDGIRNRSWEGQLGGIDGMNQFTWSFIFLGGIKQALEKLGITYQVNVKGDDVRAVIAIPSSGLTTTKQIEEIRDKILNQLKDLCAAMGWKLNPHECFVSLSLIATSKQYQVNDCWISAATKKIGKSLSLSDMLFPTMEDIVGNIFSTCHSACSQGTSVLAPFLTALTCAASEIDRDYFKHQSLTVEELAIMLMWPQCIGGPGPLPLQTYITRGENDMLSVTISLFRYMLKYGSDVEKTLILRILSQKITINPDPTLLLGNPYSIPLDVPERPMAVLRRHMKRHIADIAVHPDLKTILSVEGEKDRQNFVSTLSGCTPYLAKPLTVLWECSPFYIIDEIISRFTASSTVFAFLGITRKRTLNKRNAHLVLQKVIAAARNRHNYWVGTLRSYNYFHDHYFGVIKEKWFSNNICSAEIVNDIRHYAWGKEIVGITYPSLVEQSRIWTPDMLQILAPHWDISNVGTPILIYKDEIVFQTSDRSHHYSSIENNPPWLGHTTATKSVISKMDNESRSPVLNKLSKLLSFYVNSDTLGPHFKQLSQALIRSLTGISFDKLHILVPETGGGSIAHRAQINAYNMTTMPNYRSNLLQLVQVPKDSGGALRGDMTNRTVNFPARFYHSVFLATYPLQSMQLLPSDHPEHLFMVFHNDIRYPNIYKVCPYCCADVDDIPVEIPGANSVLIDKYRYLPLVGCSAYENLVLQQKIEKITLGKRRRAEYSMLENMKKSDAITLASFTAFSTFIASQLHVFDLSMGSNFTRIPGAELANVLMVGMSKRSIESVSINALRALTPYNLYMCVLSLYVDIMIDYIGVAEDIDNIIKSYFIMSFKNPLSNILRELALAGILSNIKIGADEAGYIHNFQWGSGVFTQLGIAAEQFSAQHVHLIKDWITAGQPLPRITLFCHSEDEVSIEEKMDKYGRQCKLIMMRTVLSAKPYTNNKKQILHLVTKLGGLSIVCDEFKHYAMSLGAVIPKQHEDIDVIGDEMYDNLLNIILPKTTTHETKILQNCLAKLYACFMIDILFGRGDWSSDDFIHVRPGAQYTVLQNNLTNSDLLDMEFPLHVDDRTDRPIIKYLVDLMGLNIVSILYNLIITNDTVMSNSEMGVQANGFIEYAESILKPINARIIGVMRLDDAISIIKKAGISLSNAIDKIRDNFHNTYNQQSNSINSTLIDQCTLGNTELCNRFMLMQQPLWISGIGNQGYSFPEVTSAIRPNTPIIPNMLFHDQKEILRYGGLNNTSVAKYADIIDKCGIHPILSDEQHPSLAICLADGLGGVTAHLLRAYPEVRVIYNSLQKLTTQLMSDSSQSDMPIEVLNSPARYNVLHRIYYRGMYPGDLTKYDMPSVIINYANSVSLPVALITCDANIDYNDGLKSAYLLWVNVLKIMYTLSSDVTRCVLKCFAVDDPTVKLIMYMSTLLFSHVHYLRSKYTRTRSTEFFIIMSNPRESVMEDNMWKALYAREIYPTPNIMVSTYIAEELNRISLEYLSFRANGITPQFNLVDSFRQMAYMRVTPLTPSLWLSSINISNFAKSLDIRNIAMFVTTYLNGEIQQVEQLLNVNKVAPKGNIVLRGKFSRVLAFGPKLVYIAIRRIIRMITCQFILQQYSDMPAGIVVASHEDLMDHIVTTLSSLNRGWEHEWQLQFQYGYLFYVTPKFYDNLSTFIHLVERKCYQIIGAWYYCAYLIVNDPINNLDQLHDFMRGLTVSEESRRYLHGIFHHRELWYPKPVVNRLRCEEYTATRDIMELLEAYPHNFEFSIEWEKCAVPPIYRSSLVEGFDPSAVDDNVEELAHVMMTKDFFNSNLDDPFD